jgi:hypothetical protein
MIGRSLSVGVQPEPRTTRWLRLIAVTWLRLGPPIALALVLERALPRLATADTALWALVLLRIGLVAVGLAIAQRLREPEARTWRALAGWAVGSIAVTLIERAWPALPSGLAPSEARVVAAAAVARDAAIACGAVWLARRGRADDGDGARDSS